MIKSLFTLTFLCMLFSCNHTEKNPGSNAPTSVDSATDIAIETKTELKNLVSYMMKWSDSKNVIDLLPLKKDAQDSFYVGFDFDKHEQNCKTLEKTGLFAKEFIDNYNKIIHTLDEKMKNGSIEKFGDDEYPPFNFSSDVNAWCLCQDTPSENPWDKIEISVSRLEDNKAELTWSWGNSEWKNFSYSVRTAKEEGKWKIAYLQGFDLKEATK